MSPPSTGDPHVDDFDWLSLDPDEDVVWSGNPHALSLVPALAVGIPLSLILVGIPIVVSAYLGRENTEFVLTTDALYKKRGVLSRDVKRVGVEKVQDTSYTQDFLGTRFGYGTVEISTAGGAGVELSFDDVPHPKHVQERVNERIRARGAGRGDGETKSDVLSDVLAELRAIRAAVEGEAAASGADGATDTDVATTADTFDYPDSEE